MTPASDSVQPFREIDRVLIEGVKEVIGLEDARAVLGQAARRVPSAPYLNEVHLALAAFYGPKSGQGLALRAGRAVFKYGLRVWGEQSGLLAPAFRLMPLKKRIRTGLERIASLLNEQCGMQVSVSEDDEGWYWQVQHCPACLASGEGEPSCHLLTGLLQEFTAWAAGGKVFAVGEIACAGAGGPACLFVIEKKPLE